MKTLPYAFLICLSFFVSCKKTENHNAELTTDQKLKKISYGIDSAVPLCTSCPPLITEKAEHFYYDNLDRLVSRMLTTTTLSFNPVITDTTSVYLYFYSDNSFMISSYTDQPARSIAINHILKYDSKNRLISDSITNPQMGNNKLTSFTYLPDTIIQYEKQSFPAGTEIKIDSMFIEGGNIVREKITSGSSFRELTYSSSTFRNPFSYINNFTLLASDYKNGANSSLFSIYTPQNITYNIASNTDIKTWNNTSPVSNSTSVLTTTLDSTGRVKTTSKSSNGNKVTTFEYF